MPVTLYSKPACVQCTSSKRKLKKHGIEFTEIDVTQDEGALAYVTEVLGYSAAPVIVAGDDHWSGFQPDKIEALVA